jgi:hypothetical protein
VTPLRFLAALLAVAVVWMPWPPAATGKGFLLGRDVRVTCDSGNRAERPREGSSSALTDWAWKRAKPVVLGCASLPDEAGTVQLSAPAHAPFGGCVLDSYTVGSRQGGLLCAHFSRAFTTKRRAAGLWITRLGQGMPSVALGAAAPRVRHVYLWYSLESGAPGITPSFNITVNRHLARRLGAPAGFNYFAAALPPDADLCQRTLVGGRAPAGAFGPAALFDSSVITRMEGAGLTETPPSRHCIRQRGTSDPLTRLMRRLNSTLAALVRERGAD